MRAMVVGAVMAAGVWCGCAAKAAPLVIDFQIDSSNFYQDPRGTGHFLSPDEFPASGSVTIDYGKDGFYIADFLLVTAAHTFTESQFNSLTPIYLPNADGSGQHFQGFSVDDIDYSEKTGIINAGIPFYFPYFRQQKTGFVFNTFPPNYEYQSFACSRCVTYNVVSGVVPVPLPASAPLFSAALIALGVVGYGMQHRSRMQIV